MIANTWNGISRVVGDAACRLSSGGVPVLLRMPAGGIVRMAVRDVDVVLARDGYALLVELCDPESEKTSKCPLDTDGGDMIQYGAKA